MIKAFGIALWLAGCDGGTEKEEVDPPVDTDPVDDTELPPDTDAGDDTDPPGPDPLACPPGASPAARTTTGCVLGAAVALHGGAPGEAFLGIPYAAPPVGPLRWRRPEPASPWQTPRVADTLGPPCPQANGTLDGALEAGDGQEDCLTLNLWRPEGAAELPVLFFIHGGGHVDGSGGQAVYADQPGLAAGAVVVTHNYRLSSLGFLAHPLLSAEDPDAVSGNQGLRDTLLALRWVRDNAAAFGGDPERILIFGESAGGLSTCALWASPDAQDLFSAALAQSAPCSAVNRPIRGSTRLVESGEDQGVRFADALACQDEPDVLACMRSRPLPRILDTLRGRQGLLDDGETYGIVIDGVLLPDGPLRAAETGSVARPLFAGANADEGLIFTAGAPITTEQAYRTVLTPFALLLRTTVQALYDLYPPEAYGGSLNAAWSAFYGDFAFVCPTRAFLRAAAPNLPARGYFFARPLLGIEATGAFHGAELGYVFGTLAPVAPAADRQLALAMQAAWTSSAGLSPTWDGAPWPLVVDAWAEVRADGALATVADLAAASRCEALTP